MKKIDDEEKANRKALAKLRVAENGGGVRGAPGIESSRTKKTWTTHGLGTLKREKGEPYRRMC
jgi:hypothetical protein